MRISSEEPSSHSVIGDAASCDPPASSSASSLPAEQGNLSVSSARISGEDEEEDLCRICKNTGDADNPLSYPCACCGSMKFVHQDCLLQWLSFSDSSRCEVCKQQFSFSLIYAEGSPTRLSFKELAVGIAMKACHNLQPFLRLSFIVLVWFLIIPILTFWIWQLSFVRSFGEAHRLFLRHRSMISLFLACLIGLPLSATIVVFMLATSLRDDFRHLQELGGQDEREDDGDRNADDARRSVGQAVRNLPDEGNGEHGGGAQEAGAVGQMIRRNLQNLLAGWDMLLVFLYLGIVALIWIAKGKSLEVGRFYGVAIKALQFFFRLFGETRHLMPMLKVAFLFIVERGVFPLMCGWWLDVCTIRTFGRTMSGSIQFLTSSPLTSTLIHWAVGIFYRFQIRIFVNLLGEVLHPEVLYFLRYLADSNYNPVDDPPHKQARRVLLCIAVYGSLIVMLVLLPGQLAMRVAPSIFPLNISFSDPFTKMISPVMLLCPIVIPFTIEHLKLRTSTKSLLRCWFTTVGWALGLTDFLLPRREDNNAQDNGNGEPRRQIRPEVLQAGGPNPAIAVFPAADDPNRRPLAAGNTSVAGEYDDDYDEQAATEYSFISRIVLLLLMAWMTLFIFNSTLLVAPVWLGRGLLNFVSPILITYDIKWNDLDAFIIGAYAICTLIAGVRYSVEHIRAQRTSLLLGQTWKWCGIAMKSSALLSGWCVIPVLIGLLFERLVTVPIKIPVDESPLFLLYKNWAFGLMCHTMWISLVIFNHIIPIWDNSWRDKIQTLRDNGFSRPGLQALREILIHIEMKLLMAELVPDALSRWVFPMLGFRLVVSSAVYRSATFSCYSFGVICFCVKIFSVCFPGLHNMIRDERYSVARRVLNHGEDRAESGEAHTVSTSSRSGRQGDVLIRHEDEDDATLRLRRVNAQQAA